MARRRVGDDSAALKGVSALRNGRHASQQLGDLLREVLSAVARRMAAKYRRARSSPGDELAGRANRARRLARLVVNNGDAEMARAHAKRASRSYQ